MVCNVLPRPCEAEHNYVFLLRRVSRRMKTGRFYMKYKPSHLPGCRWYHSRIEKSASWDHGPGNLSFFLFWHLERKSITMIMCWIKLFFILSQTQKASILHEGESSKRVQTFVVFVLSFKSSSSSSCSVRRWRLLSKHTAAVSFALIQRNKHRTYNNHSDWKTFTPKISSLKLHTYSPADNRFCFSSFLIRGRPGFIFRGEVGVFCAAGWMKWANNSVCLRRYSNLLVRSVCCKYKKTRLLIVLF